MCSSAFIFVECWVTVSQSKDTNMPICVDNSNNHLCIPSFLVVRVYRESVVYSCKVGNLLWILHIICLYLLLNF